MVRITFALCLFIHCLTLLGPVQGGSKISDIRYASPLGFRIGVNAQGQSKSMIVIPDLLTRMFSGWMSS